MKNSVKLQKNGRPQRNSVNLYYYFKHLSSALNPLIKEQRYLEGAFILGFILDLKDNIDNVVIPGLANVNKKFRRIKYKIKKNAKGKV